MTNAQINFPGLELRPLQDTHIPAAMALVEEVGWNQVPEDWRMMLNTGDAVGLFHKNDRLVATALSLPYPASFAWISMVIVSLAWRRRGLANGLLQHCRQLLETAGKVAFLDATEAGREVYLPLGFKDIYAISRWHSGGGTGAIALPHSAVNTAAWQVKAISQNDISGLAQWDRSTFGADRGPLLQSQWDRSSNLAHLALDRQGKILGYGLARNGRIATQIGPVVALDDAIAQALIFEALRKIPGPVFIDLLDRHKNNSSWLAEMGFTRQRGFMRMAYQHETPVDDPDRIYVIAGPELG